MFKTCMKNYFHNLKYIFTVLGVMFLAFMTGVSAFFRQTGLSLSTLSENISEAVKSTDFSLFGVEGGFFQVLANYGGFTLEFLGSILAGVAGIALAVLFFFLIQAVGVYVSNLIVILYERYDIHHDNVFKVILEQLCRSILILIFLILIFLLAVYVAPTVGMVLLVLYPLLYCFVALLSAWLTAGKTCRKKWKDFVTFRHMLALFASNVLQILITFAVGSLSLSLFNSLVGIPVCVALFVLAASTTNLNAYAMLYGSKKGNAASAAAAADPAETAASPYIPGPADPVPAEEKKTE